MPAVGTGSISGNDKGADVPADVSVAQDNPERGDRQAEACA
jgi:hypothetical protein